MLFSHENIFNILKCLMKQLIYFCFYPSLKLVQLSVLLDIAFCFCAPNYCILTFFQYIITNYICWSFLSCFLKIISRWLIVSNSFSLCTIMMIWFCSFVKIVWILVGLTFLNHFCIKPNIFLVYYIVELSGFHMSNIRFSFIS